MAVGSAPTLLDMPPRLMWGWEPKVSGYCGSVSVQTAGLYYGNYLSEGKVRGSASGGVNAAHQLLIGYEKDIAVRGASVHDACQALGMNCSMWDYNKEPSPQHAAFVAWVADAIDAGEPVIAGVYWGVEDDDDYDHIVPLVGYERQGGGAISALYFNDLHTNATLRGELTTFVQTRRGCDSSERFGPHSFCLPRATDYGVVVHGNQDTRGELLPLRLSTDLWTEPDYSKEDKQHEAPVSLSATVTASGLSSGSTYALLRFEDFTTVPHEDFLQGPFASKIEFVAARDGTHNERVTFMSNSTTLFRCVLVRH